MILYHGTSTRHLKAILEKGLLPRNVTGVSNWHGEIESKKDFIYLSTAYPVYFALASAKENDEQLLILEIEVEEKLLYPDEDYIAQCLHHHDPMFKKMALEDINPFVDLETYKQYWPQSLNACGNVCIKKVLPRQIKRHVTIPVNQETIQDILSIGGDSMPIPLNYRLLGHTYRKAIEVLFDEGLDASVNARNKAMGYPPDIMAKIDESRRKMKASVKASAKAIPTKELPAWAKEEAEKTIPDEWGQNEGEGEIGWILKKVPVAEVISEEVNFDERFEQRAEAISRMCKKTKRIDPIVIGPSGIEGKHRIRAAEILGITEIDAYVVVPDIGEAEEVEEKEMVI